ncbi:hypothetical protein BO79DRAFT_264452 [Aspergillus costaricaensis CBS 115574]|uniref:Uncharacterized protein n=1 Tax=Aspergillus costaricaensis CBS 115574 TaxID=1448317 RepID=A0ACD1IFG0_9EURO|nr:hypothetical protein BO79DRAFT_264452 [Aspergillus costaricaensis CBS 115574]RAK89154.1 hypothetical protein BO79DRAFT_264452 [Aspergillus costaricaensis CBS 115574]
MRVAAHNQRPPFEPLKFIPPGEREAVLDLPIRWVNVVAHDPLEGGGNHWCFYLNVTDARSVRIDMTPSYTVPGVTNRSGSKGIMVVSHLSYAVSRSAEKVMQIQSRPGCKARDFINLLVSQKRHQYEFTADGEGCRFWTDQQIDFLQRSGLLVDPTQVAAAKNAILTKWPSGGRYPLVVGTYYP